jgi:phosphate-selective porin
MRTTKLIVAMFTMIAVLISATPLSAQAAPPPRTWTKTMTEDELADANLSIGVIKWNDSLVKGQITVTPNKKDDKYTVVLEEYYNINDMKDTKKAKAKRYAQNEFKDVREHCQSKGWWDCKFKIKSTSSTKVTATAKIEYKAVKVNEKSQTVSVKITWKKKKGVWTSTYTVGKKKYSAETFKALFN